MTSDGETLNDPAAAVPRYKRETPMGDGCFVVSTVSTWRCCRYPETMIFDERTGNGRFRVQHLSADTREELDAVHEDVTRRFAAGALPLGDYPAGTPAGGPGRRHRRGRRRLRRL